MIDVLIVPHLAITDEGRERRYWDEDAARALGAIVREFQARKLPDISLAEFGIIDFCEMGPPSCVGCTGMPNCRPCPRAGVAQRPQRDEWGFSIQVPRSDPKFREDLGGGMYRWRHDELLAILVNAVRSSFGLFVPEVHWARDSAWYTYQLFLEARR